MGDTTSSRPYLSYRMIKTSTTEGRIRRLTVPQVTVYRYAEPVRLSEHRTSTRRLTPIGTAISIIRLTAAPRLRHRQN